LTTVKDQHNHKKQIQLNHRQELGFTHSFMHARVQPEN